MLKTILIVDDRVINLEFLATLLGYAGYHVQKAVHGAQALEMALLEPPALVISDILMPIMDGVELVKRLRADPRTAHIPVIFYTATYTVNDTQLMTGTFGVSAVLTKPAEPQKILETVAQALGDVFMLPGEADSSATEELASVPELGGLQYRLQQALTTNIDVDAEPDMPGHALYALANVQALSMRLAALLELSMTLSAERDLQRLLERFCRSTQNIMNATHTAVGMRSKNKPKRGANWGMADNDIDAIFDALDANSGILRERLANGDTLDAGNIETDLLQLAPDHPLWREFMIVPIMMGSHLDGWFYLAGKIGVGGFTVEDREFATTLAAQLAPLYENLSLYEEIRQHVGQLETEVIERKEQERKVARLSRFSAVLSGINSAIVRIHDRNALFHEACRIAVNLGAFGMAWVGVIDPVTQVGQVVASSGGQGGYAEQFTASSDACNSSDSDFPWCVAVREQRPVICNDIHMETALLPRLSEFQAQGYQSLAAFPLMLENQAVAVITLFSDEVGVFDEEELKLLNELAGDLSFGLRFIDKEEKLSYLACYDVLTGLPNSMLFHDRLTQFLQGAKHDSGMTCVILLDLDQFSQLNDVLGRHAGDAVLSQVAERLGASLNEPYSLARISGDIFAIAVPDMQPSTDAASILEQQIFDAFSTAFIVDKQEIRITARAGLALYPDDGRDAETLFKHAEIALKKAKSSDERFLYYAPQMNAALAVRLALKSELQLALDTRQFVVYYQPRVDLVSGRIVSAEALIRWLHPQRGMVPPDHFIPLAEETGLIVPIGAWVIDAVCAQQALWLTQGVAIVPVAVNLSAVQFKKGLVLQTIQDTIQRHQLEAKFIEFELTESIVMSNPEEATGNLEALKQLDLKLALDDFGTGYSSLAYLKRFPFDFLKIDRAFITDITKSSKDAMIATAVIAMGHSLDLRVVAEGVETEEQLDYLRRHRCDEIQGYHFSRPVPAADFEAMLRAGKRLAPAQNPDERSAT